MSTARSIQTTLATLFAVVGAAGCGANDGSSVVSPAAADAEVVTKTKTATAAPRQVKFALDEFGITPSAATAKAGRVKISAVNKGKKTHELLVVTSGGRLPVKGGEVDEAALERAHRVLGEIADVHPGRSGSRTFTLKEGSYMLFCNLPGHYEAGMRGTLVVRRAAGA